MTITDKSLYRKYRKTRILWNPRQTLLVNFWLPVFLFGSIGAITWAIRGTDGWSGIEGTIIPGMTWALLWYYLSYRKGIDSRSIVLWLGLGIAIGGELGYGQYISWIMGRFSVGKDMPYLEISRWQGDLWLFICGVSWGGVGGIILGWALKKKASIKMWVIRLLFSFGFAGLGWVLVKLFPALFFPHYSHEFYTEGNCPSCMRTIYTNTQNFIVLMWWLGALFTAMLQKDKPTQVTGSLLGLGFGCVFSVSAAWCMGYDFAPGYIDWWKMWELTAGFGLGALYAVAMYWAINKVDKDNDSGAAFVDEGKVTIKENVKSISLIFSIALLFYILFHGASYQIGGFLGFYETSVSDQYSWPTARIFIFVPVAFFIIAIALIKLRQSLNFSQAQQHQTFQVQLLHEKITGLLVGITVIGVITIWPSKIGVLYVVFLCIVIFAFNSLNYHHNKFNESCGT